MQRGWSQACFSGAQWQEQSAFKPDAFLRQVCRSLRSEKLSEICRWVQKLWRRTKTYKQIFQLHKGLISLGSQPKKIITSFTENLCRQIHQIWVWTTHISRILTGEESSYPYCLTPRPWQEAFIPSKMCAVPEPRWDLTPHRVSVHSSCSSWGFQTYLPKITSPFSDSLGYSCKSGSMRLRTLGNLKNSGKYLWHWTPISPVLTGSTQDLKSSWCMFSRK